MGRSRQEGQQAAVAATNDDVQSPYFPPEKPHEAVKLWRVDVTARAVPGILARVVDQFAKRSLIPHKLSWRCDPEGRLQRSRIEIVIQTHRPQIERICEFLRTVPDIHGVRLRTFGNGTKGA